MDRDSVDYERRRLLALATGAVTAGLAGCGGGTETPTPAEGEVPSEYETATSIGGAQRDPDALATQDAVNYQPEPNGGQQCSNCRFYIEDKNGDGVGACTLVEGEIEPQAWCSSYVSYEGSG